MAIINFNIFATQFFTMYRQLYSPILVATIVGNLNEDVPTLRCIIINQYGFPEVIHNLTALLLK